MIPCSTGSLLSFYQSTSAALGSRKEPAFSFEENWNAKNWRKNRERIGIPRMTVSISVPDRSVLAWQPLAGESLCRLLLLSQHVFVCQTACITNLRLYCRLQIGESHIQNFVCQLTNAERMTSTFKGRRKWGNIVFNRQYRYQSSK